MWLGTVCISLLDLGNNILPLTGISPAITGRYMLQISRFTRRGEARARSSSSLKPESLPILVLETVTILLASIYRGFLARMRSHPRLVNPPRLGGNPRRGLARIVLVSHVCLHPSHP